MNHHFFFHKRWCLQHQTTRLMPTRKTGMSSTWLNSHRLYRYYCAIALADGRWSKQQTSCCMNPLFWTESGIFCEPFLGTCLIQCGNTVPSRCQFCDPNTLHGTWIQTLPVVQYNCGDSEVSKIEVRMRRCHDHLMHCNAFQNCSNKESPVDV